jgi:hypothetical protein
LQGSSAFIQATTLVSNTSSRLFRFRLTSPAMVRSRFNTFSRRRLSWLLWLVLLLPMGQLAATWHVLSHVHSGQVSGNDGDQAIHEDQCELCPSAAALIGGAPVASSSDLPQLTALYGAPLVALHGVVWTAPTRAYNSRAPPLLLL